ncbi:MAG: ATP-dependent helicase [Rhodobacteraceae bacterium]|nr:ATP-dependent helicase [Paracoccaceae bacterium]
MLLETLIEAAPKGAKGKDVQVATTIGELIQALKGDPGLPKDLNDPSSLLDHALLWMHEQGAVTLGRGLTIFRPAITVRLAPKNRIYTHADFEPLKIHYDEQTLQTHIMATYAECGLNPNCSTRRFRDDYFKLDRQAFIEKWIPDRTVLRRQTTPESWRSIVESLGNSDQIKIVKDDRVETNVLVLAGPGSGKTRVLVHRIAFLIRVLRQHPNGILALVYNRHAATEIRWRLSRLLGDDARGVTVLTCHGLAMRLVGASFSGRDGKIEAGEFDEVLKQAIELLRGDGLSTAESEAQRDTLIEGYRWILVDEYQDIGEQEYELIAAIAGRSTEDEDSRLSLFAVGDDDQNIYAFRGSSVDYIRRFATDYKAKPDFLIENYRSTGHIIRGANMLIAPCKHRMKTGHDIVIDSRRQKEPPGAELQRRDPIGHGRVQVLRIPDNERAQAILALSELQRLSLLRSDWSWNKAAVIARNWKWLVPVRSCCEARGIPVQVASDEQPNIWRLRETQRLVDWLKGRPNSTIRTEEISKWMRRQADGPWWSLLREGVEDFVLEAGEREAGRSDIIEWIAEWSRDARKRQTGLLLLSAHRAKGLEFDDVIVLDGGWGGQSKRSDEDEERRLYYVAMTRARRSLALLSLGGRQTFAEDLEGPAIRRHSPQVNGLDLAECGKTYLTLGPKDVFLDFAGRLGDNDRSLQAIEKISAGDPVSIKHGMIVDQSGIPIGRLAKNFKLPDKTLIAGKVHTVIMRTQAESGEDFRNQLRREKWDIVLPELVFS